METISILANTGDRRLDNTAFAAGTFSWQDPVHSWKTGPGEVKTVEKEICLKPAHFLSAQMALVSTFFQMFIAEYNRWSTP